jgi:hypothetical protein
MGLYLVKSVRYVPKPLPKRNPKNTLPVSWEMAEKAVWNPVCKGSMRGFCEVASWYTVTLSPARMMKNETENIIVSGVILLIGLFLFSSNTVGEDLLD